MERLLLTCTHSIPRVRHTHSPCSRKTEYRCSCNPAHETEVSLRPTESYRIYAPFKGSFRASDRHPAKPKSFRRHSAPPPATPPSPRTPASPAEGDFPFLQCTWRSTGPHPPCIRCFFFLLRRSSPVPGRASRKLRPDAGRGPLPARAATAATTAATEVETTPAALRS